MTKIISYYPKSGYKLPSSIAGAGNSTTETTKGELAPARVDDAVTIFFNHFIVTFIMLVSFIIPAFGLWWGDWPCFAIHGIVYLYSTVMINLLMMKLRGRKKSWELEKGCNEEVVNGPKLTSMLMLSATGVTLISLGLLVLVFRPDWDHLAFIALLVMVSTSFIVLGLAAAEYEREQKLRERCKDPMDLV